MSTRSRNTLRYGEAAGVGEPAAAALPRRTRANIFSALSMDSRERRAGELSVFGPSSNPMMAACDCDVAPRTGTGALDLAPKSLRISTWAGAGHTYECVAYAAKLEVTIGLRLGQRQSLFGLLVCHCR